MNHTATASNIIYNHSHYITYLYAGWDWGWGKGFALGWGLGMGLGSGLGQWLG